MTHRAEFTLALTLRSPFIFQGLGAAATGIDTRALRDEAGRPIIPADQVKGILRAAFVSLAEATGGRLVDRADIDALFGAPSPEREDVAEGDEQDRPVRGALIFADLTAEPHDGADWKDRRTITRIEIEPQSGSVKRGSLQVVELVAAPGTEVRFAGRAVVRTAPLMRPERWSGGKGPDAFFVWLAGVLDKAARLIPAAGALKSAGFGEVVRAKVALDDKSVSSLALPGTPAKAPLCQSYRVRFDRRILVDTERIADNVRKGACIVPGAVFKGALAERLRLAGLNPEDTTREPGRTLARMRFCHAFPQNEHGERSGLPIPLSVIADGDGNRFADALLPAQESALPPHEQAAMLDGKAPRYLLDWKTDWFGKGAAHCGLAEFDEPAPLPRAHVRIGTDYVAEEGKLFVDAARSHLIGGDPERLRAWRLDVHIPQEDAKAAAPLLEILEQGLDGVGATGASARFEKADPQTAKIEPVPGHSELWGNRCLIPMAVNGCVVGGDPGHAGADARPRRHIGSVPAIRRLLARFDDSRTGDVFRHPALCRRLRRSTPTAV
jgi:hypothetical protein